MDLQAIVDGMYAATCVVSVEIPKGDESPIYRIVTGNQKYIDSIEHPAPGAEMLTDKFIPDSEYTRYLTRDLNFEEYCYQAAVEKKCLHSYVNPERIPVWFNMSFIPVEGGDENISYCLYMMEINFSADPGNMSNFSAETASRVLETCLLLRGATDFRAAMKKVIEGVRDLCEAEHCCILLIDDYNMQCEVLGEAFSDNTDLLPMGTYLNREFYDIAKSWEDTIGGSNCIIMKSDSDRAYVKEKNPVWYESLISAGGENIVLFPLKSGNRLLGYMWAINFDAVNAVKIKETLELRTFVLGSEIGNYMLIDSLKISSTRDLLTGVMNRNEMNNYVSDLFRRKVAKGQSVGVIFADVNGIKKLNDQSGHTAGDILLKESAEALKSLFDEEQIFRAGGDEFSIILTGVSEDEIGRMVEAIRDLSKANPRVSFSAGGSVAGDGKEIHRVFRFAYERMVKDKTRYYDEHPELLRSALKGDVRF